VLACAACNLARAQPTPTRDPNPTATEAPPIVPTLFPSITPLGFFATVDPARTPLGDVTPCPIPAAWVGYVVQAGDSLFALASATGTTADSIVVANCLDDPDSLIAGQTIYLPRQPDVG